ncbi:MFS transporter [Bdellovibrio sp. HCB337]|uniref:MFS transporter n=1 Tax=Bdellovibrio sp. HCB337 TaxID=3394358 RepID=UPI0039A55EE4
MKLTLPRKLLLGRLLTRSGDQAWDFAVPLILLKIFPDQIRIAALYYFLVKLLNVLLLPKVASLIDRMSRQKTANLGIFLQLAGVLIGTSSITYLSILNSSGNLWSDSTSSMMFVFLVLGGLLSSSGSSFMDIAISSDLVPSSLQPQDLSQFNSRLQQVDLFTEVTAPVLAGLLLLIDQPTYLTGFFLVALWNVLSFFPELGLLRSIFQERPDLVNKQIIAAAETKESLWHKLTSGWRAFFKEPVALVAIAYACLWLSVLSPHGVLLSGYLKDAWQLPEWAIGIFRGAGAFFGLAATFVFPLVVKKKGLPKASQVLIIFQSCVLLLGLVCFFAYQSLWGQVGFLVAILISRIGLYGFSLGEMQIRQTHINPEVRGQVNGFASALTGVATLLLFGAGTLIPKTSDFQYLVVGSVGFVCLGALIYSFWLRSQQKI